MDWLLLGCPLACLCVARLFVFLHIGKSFAETVRMTWPKHGQCQWFVIFMQHKLIRVRCSQTHTRTRRYFELLIKSKIRKRWTNINVLSPFYVLSHTRVLIIFTKEKKKTKINKMSTAVRGLALSCIKLLIEFITCNKTKESIANWRLHSTELIVGSLESGWTTTTNKTTNPWLLEKHKIDCKFCGRSDHKPLDQNTSRARTTNG